MKIGGVKGSRNNETVLLGGSNSYNSNIESGVSNQQNHLLFRT